MEPDAHEKLADQLPALVLYQLEYVHKADRAPGQPVELQ
jgi:hypothetical protein